MYINPYRPGAGIAPKYLAGREMTIQFAKSMLDNLSAGYTARSVIYYGLRGVGKTVLLNKIEDMANEQNIPTEYLEVVEHKRNFQATIALHIYKLIHKLSMSKKIESYARRALGILKAFSVKYSTENQELAIEFDPIKGIADTGDLSNDITELFLSLGKIAFKEERGVIFLIDEIQYLKESEFEALITALHRANQKDYPLAIFAAGLPKIAKIAGNIKSYAERLFNFIEIGSLTKDEAKLALTKPADKFAVTYENAAIEKIISVTQGYPYFIQEYGKWIWKRKGTNTKIKLSLVESAYSDFENSLDKSFFKVRHDRATPREIDFMKAMVLCDELPCNTKEIAEVMNESQQAISPLRAQLIHKGFIYATTRGKVDFTVPQFDNYLRRIYEI